MSIKIMEFILARLAQDVAAAQQSEQREGERVARLGSDRIRREVEAKRLLLAQHQHEEDDDGSEWCWGCYAEDRPIEDWAWPCRTVRILAAVYSDHDDYDPAWAL